MQTLFELIKKTTMLSDDIPHVLDLAIQKDFKGFASCFVNVTGNYSNRPIAPSLEIGSNDIYINRSITNVLSRDIYIIESCLFVVRDLNDTLTNLKSLGYTITKEQGSNKSELNSLEVFMSYVDGAYREFLWALHDASVKHKLRQPLPKSKFTYNNVHKNICGKTL